MDRAGIKSIMSGGDRYAPSGCSCNSVNIDNATGMNCPEQFQFPCWRSLKEPMPDRMPDKLEDSLKTAPTGPRKKHLNHEGQSRWKPRRIGWPSSPEIHEASDFRFHLSRRLRPPCGRR